jgi:hypothetical protein
VNKKTQKAIWWKWTVVASIIIGILTLIEIYVINPMCQNKLAHERLEYEVEPSITLTFEPKIGLPSDSSFFLIKNQGPGTLEHAWFVEKVFLVESDGVSECPDLPHFEYFHFEGSLRTMGELKAGQENRIYLSRCWRKAIAIFLSRFRGTLISRFVLTGISRATPRFDKEFFFVIDPRNCDYIAVENFIGGKKAVDDVNNYIAFGRKSEIRWIAFENRFLGFYKNPSRYWYTTSDGQSVPWDGTGLPPFELSSGKAIIPVLFSPYVFIPNKNSYAKLDWECDSSMTGPTVELMGSAESW